jgi:hypothetical protein
VGRRRVRAERIDVSVFLFGDRVTRLSSPPKDWHHEPIFEEIDVEPAVQSSAFDVRSPLMRHSGTIPSKQICEHANLWLNLPGWDTYDGQGKRISVNTSTGAFGSLEKSVYMRLDVLERCLKDKGLTLIWIVWGERQRLMYRKNKNPAQ